MSGLELIKTIKYEEHHLLVKSEDAAKLSFYSYESTG